MVREGGFRAAGLATGLELFAQDRCATSKGTDLPQREEMPHWG